MRYLDKLKKKNVVSKVDVEVNFLFAMRNEENTLIDEFFSIYIAERFDNSNVDLYKMKFIAKFVGDDIEIVGLTGKCMVMDGRNVYKYVNDNREEFFYYDLDFTFMDRMLVEGGDELANKIADAKSIKIASYMKNIGYHIGIIDRFRKKYKMEEQI